MKKLREVVFYNGDALFPLTYVMDKIECKNLEEELKNKLAHITQRVRKMFGFRDDVLDSKIYEALYILQEDGLTSVRDIA
jgi:hypothetical protein